MIVGGGAIGLSIAMHLGDLGVSDVLLLERHQLTSGTSWHAAGIVGPLRASMNLTRLAQYAIELFADLQQRTGQDTGYRRTGGIWLAQTAARMVELRRLKAMGDRSGLHAEMLGPREIASRFALVRCDDLAGGLWVEEDSQVNPVDLCMAYARAARAQGVELRENSAVTSIDVADGGLHGVVLADGRRINCRRLVLAAGAWSRQLAAGCGIGLPLVACEHMYLVTDVVDDLPDPCPILRDLDGGIYFKGDNGKLVLGAFEANPKPWQAAAGDAPFLMFDEDWEQAAPMLDAGIHRVPAIADQGITHFMNGPETFTPDTRQLMGEVPGCRGLFVAAGFNSIGIVSSAGVGKVMARWVRDGAAPMDLWEVDLQRLDPLMAGDEFLQRRLPEAVHNQFAMHWPFKQYRGGRDLRRSAWHQRLAARGAVFGAPTGWERPLWYAVEADESALRYSHERQCWWPAARREARHCSAHASLFELSPFAKFEVRGPGALAWLQTLCCSDLDLAAGRIRYTLLLNERGGIEAELTVTRLAADRFWIVGGAATRFKDLEWLRRHLPDGGLVELRDRTDEYAVLGLMGPASRELMQAASGLDCRDTAFPFASARVFAIDGTEALALRLSYVGELGWEVYLPLAQAEAWLERLLELDFTRQIGMAGHFALDACRLEIGFRHWGHDMGPDDTPYECELGFAVALDKRSDFIGRQALLEQQERGWRKQSKLCRVLADEVLLLHEEPVYRGTRIVGHCTSGGLGFRCQQALAFVMFYDRADLVATDFEIGIAGERYPLAVLDQPPRRPAR